MVGLLIAERIIVLELECKVKNMPHSPTLGAESHFLHLWLVASTLKNKLFLNGLHILIGPLTVLTCTPKVGTCRTKECFIKVFHIVFNIA